MAVAFAFATVWSYLVPMNKYSPLVSEFGSAEEEAAYNEWFRKKVKASMASDKPRIPHDEVMARIDRLLEEKKRRKKC